jgi:hypothetical protein
MYLITLFSIAIFTAHVIDAKNAFVIPSRNRSVIAESYVVPWFLRVAPFFDLTKVDGVNAVCKRDFQSFLSAMDRLELWALKSEFFPSFK